MSEPVSFTEAADRIRPRARPRPVSRLNRKVLIAGVGVGALGLFAAAMVALSPPTARGGGEPRELYNTRNRATAEGLSALPSSYARLGAPLPGDLGGTVLAAERNLGIAPEFVTPVGDMHDFRPSPEEETARALRMRKAQQAEAALAAPVFFQLSQKDRDVASASSGAAPSAFDRAGLGDLMTLAKSAAGAGLALQTAQPGAADPNLQSRKIAFASEGVDEDIYNPHGLQDPVSPFQALAGTIIPASLITGLNSDLPGTLVAQVTQNVFDTVTGRHLLVPQGARLLGRYQSEVAFGQDRALIVWDRLIFPDGSSLRIDALPGSDASGYSGLSDKTDNHWGRIWAAAGLATLLGVGTELASDSDDELVRALREAGQDTVARTGQRIVDRQLNVQPTIRVRPGAQLRIIVTRDLVLRPYATGDNP